MAPEEKRARLLEAAAALLNAAPEHCMNTVSLNKGLFYTDLACLRDQGETFTGNSYIALAMGPVVAKYPDRLIRPLSQERIAEQHARENAKPVILLSLPKFKWITDDVMDITRKVSRWCCNQTSASLSEFSHGNAGWLIAREDEQYANGQKQVIDLHIAMQQIMDGDPWMDQPLTSATIAACNLADSKAGRPW
jgi:hypothetical protein